MDSLETQEGKIIATEQLYMLHEAENPHEIRFRINYSDGVFDQDNLFHRLIWRCQDEAMRLLQAPFGTGQYLQAPDPAKAFTHALFEIEVFESGGFAVNTGVSGANAGMAGTDSLAVQLSRYLADYVDGLQSL